MKARVLGVVASAVLLSACAATVGGNGHPAPAPPSESRLANGQPCKLLTEREAVSLGLVGKGEFRAGEPRNLIPPTCSWAAEDDRESSRLSAGYETSFSLADYMLGDSPLETLEFGGLKWGRYASVASDSVCLLATELDDTSFVVLVSSDLDDKAKACDLAKTAAPFVASHLPGGRPAPEPTIETPEPSPLASLDPCTLLRPEEAERLELRGIGDAVEEQPGLDLPPGCSWLDTDGQGGWRDLLVYAGDRPVEEWYFAETPGEPVEAGGRTWTLHPEPSDFPGDCIAALAFTERSSVVISHANADDPARGCEKVREAVPLITAHLPAA
ncbi:DUF3558 family protein [Prauserella oleivorans]|uniref:DUF3558 family protein n=1 Tax=Prauserella oleivorans TaxID=1478153 RepID=A0ABW5WHM4_9PSEU